MNSDDKLKMLLDMQQSEADLHWKRNNIFLLCSSILLLALSQFSQRKFRITIAGLGIILNVSWLLIQYRSSSYTQYWKAKAQELKDLDQDLLDMYPRNLKGIETRIIAHFLPIIFIIIWILVFIFGFQG